MRRALIGHTGFVGGNLARQSNFDCLYNSKNIDEIRGQRFDEVYCAGVSAVKWWANQHPEEDRAGIERLLAPLAEAQADRFVLISTVDVYKTPLGVDEDTPTEEEGLHAYGRHRLEVERFVAERFPAHCVVRLPGLFGQGLKKNVIYDFLHDNEVHKIHSEGVFQFYGLDHIAADVARAVAAGLNLVNFATEPVSVREIAHAAFGREFSNDPGYPAVSYDIQTRFAEIYERPDCYIRTKTEVLREIAKFIATEL